MTKVTILNVTNKPGGMDVLRDNLDKQTYHDFELVIVDGLYDWRKKEVESYFSHSKYSVQHIKEPMKHHKDVWTLNKSYNEGLRRASGELVISLQDYIWIKGTGIEQFVDLYEEYGPEVAISGIGHKAEYPNRADDIEGKISIWNSIFVEVPTGISEADHRMSQDKQVEDIPHSLFELNWAAFPLQGLKYIGGFDESYDQGYSCDNFNLSFRLSLLGYKFLLDRSNECIGFNQKDIFPRPPSWEEKHNRYKRHPETIHAMIKGEMSYKLNYLK